MDASEFERQVARRLRATGLRLQDQPSIGGLRPDFLVEGPGGELVVIEVKAWGARHGNIARALKQVEHYREATGADKAFLVIPDANKRSASKGVVTPTTIVPALQAFFAREKPKRPRRKGTERQVLDKSIFAAMPFDGQYDDTYFVAMAHAAESVDAACTRVDQVEFSGDIVEEIKGLIKDSVGVIADLSDARPNVLYETGYAHALQKPTVHICSTPLNDLPFDVRNWNTITYERGQTTALRDPLARRLRSVLARPVA